MSADEREVCQVCDRPYPIWCAPSDLWNTVIRGGAQGGSEHYSFVCPTCFGLLADEALGERTLWIMRPEEPGDFEKFKAVTTVGVPVLGRPTQLAERLREELMRCGLLAVSNRQDGCVSKTAALRIREIVHRTCWPDDAAPVRGEQP